MSASPLARELVGENYVDLYRHNLQFKIAIDSLTRMLPAMVEGLAQEAIETEAQREAILAEMAAAHPGWVSFWDDDPYTEVAGVSDE